MRKVLRQVQTTTLEHTHRVQTNIIIDDKARKELDILVPECKKVFGKWEEGKAFNRLSIDPIFQNKFYLNIGIYKVTEDKNGRLSIKNTSLSLSKKHVQLLIAFLQEAEQGMVISEREIISETNNV